MSADPPYVYGQGQSSRSTHPILLGMVSVEVIGYKERKYRPVWRRIGLLFPVFLTLLWVALSEANYFKERYMNGIPTTRRADMYLYLPDTLADATTRLFLDRTTAGLRERARLLSKTDTYGRAAHLRRKGEYYLSVAKDALARRDYAEFARYIGTGAQLIPDNLEAQMLCARLFFAFQRPLDAYELVEKALEFAKQDKDFFLFYIGQCEALDQDGRLIRTAGKYLQDPTVDPVIHRILQLAAAKAHLLRGEFVEANALLSRHGLEQYAEGYTLRCEVLWNGGDRDEALDRLTRLIGSYPGNIELYEKKFQWLLEKGDVDAARDLADLLRIRLPESLAISSIPLLLSLQVLRGEENAPRRAEICAELLRRFGNDELTMFKLTSFGNQTADVELTRRLAQHARDRRFTNRVKFDMVHVECLLNAGRARETILLVDSLYLQAENERWLPETRMVFEALRTIAFFADGQPDIGSINLRKLMLNRKVPSPLLLAASRKLLAARRYDEANEVLIQAHLQNEADQAVLMQIVRTKLDHPRLAGDLVTYLRRLMESRRPSREVLLAARQRLGSDAFLFSPRREELLGELEASLK